MRVSGSDYFGIFLSPDIVDEIERFVGGEKAPEIPESVLATVMFTDIVSSTEHVAEIGDRAWRDLLAQHHAIVRRELGRFRGQERDTAGDGFFATFDGPARAIRAAEAIVEGVRTDRAAAASRSPSWSAIHPRLTVDRPTTLFAPA
jgi:class 3 adenylate cyclase